MWQIESLFCLTSKIEHLTHEQPLLLLNEAVVIQSLFESSTYSESCLVALEKETATHASILAYRFHGQRSLGLQRIEHNLATKPTDTSQGGSPLQFWTLAVN